MKRSVVLASDRSGQGDAFQSAFDLAMHPGLDRPKLGHLDPAIAGIDADAVVAGLLSPLALEARVTRFLPGVEKTLEGMIEIEACLLESNGIRFFQPSILARFLGNWQQLLEVVFRAQRLAVALEAVKHDAQAGVVAEAHRAELTIQKFRLLGRGIDT